MSGGYKGKRTAYGRQNMLAAAVIAVVVLAAAAALLWIRSAGAEPPAGSAGGRQTGVSSAAQPGSGSEPVRTPEPVREEAPPVDSLPKAERYDFSQPAPEREAVDNSYFADAAFVGDSRTDGFLLYSGIGAGKNLTSNGLSIFKLGSKKALTVDGEKYTLLEALALEQYGKVYLSLGVNELGTYDDEGFYASYCDAIDRIREVQPGAVIYIQGLIPLNEEKIREANGNKFNLTNEHLRVYNDLMRRAAQEKQVVYLDLYSEFVDENNELPRDESRDGVHLVKDACKRWLTYLQTHTVDFDVLYPDGPPAVENTAPEQMPEDGSVQG